MEREAGQPTRWCGGGVQAELFFRKPRKSMTFIKSPMSLFQ